MHFLELLRTFSGIAGVQASRTNYSLCGGAGVERRFRCVCRGDGRIDFLAASAGESGRSSTKYTGCSGMDPRCAASLVGHIAATSWPPVVSGCHILSSKRYRRRAKSRPIRNNEPRKNAPAAARASFCGSRRCLRGSPIWRRFAHKSGNRGIADSVLPRHLTGAGGAPAAAASHCCYSPCAALAPSERAKVRHYSLLTHLSRTD